MEQTENMQESEVRDILLRNVKKEVKQIMEESVTRKFVHEESSSVISLCAAVECCLQHGLKKRSLGLFKNSTTMALLQKVAKSFEPAAQLIKILNDLEKMQDNRKSIDSTASAASSSSSSSSSSSNHLLYLSKKTNPKYLWLRLALYEKQLAKIVDHLVRNNSKYYEREALISDPVSGAILASLLVGPCALEFTHMKTVDHLWTDPPAKELMQRHRIHSSTNHHLVHSDSPKRLALQIQKMSSSTLDEPSSLSSSTSTNMATTARTTPMIAKEYVESLHQNNKSTLLYGKNNVIIQPKEDIQPMAGYLSLHQNNAMSLVVKWTPNQLMNINNDNNSVDTNVVATSGSTGGGGGGHDRRPIYVKYTPTQKFISKLNGTRSQYWNYAMAINLDDIVYLHCHQQADSGGTIVMVGHDGVQRPPIRLPRGGHMHAFLSCIESGLCPHGHLEPPVDDGVLEADALPTMIKKKLGGASHTLSSLIGSMTDEITSAFNQSQSTNSSPKQQQRNQMMKTPLHNSLSTPVNSAATSAGTTMTKIEQQQSQQHLQNKSESDVIVSHEDLAMDYVFRIVMNNKPTTSVSDIIQEQDERSSKDESLSSASNDDLINNNNEAHNHRTAVRQLCDTMTSQILSRAFYGWLSHCRQLKTVRTHLSGLVNPTIHPSIHAPGEKPTGLTKECWSKLIESGKVSDEMLLYKLVYYGGCNADIRKEVWPFLLGHYKINSGTNDRTLLDERMRDEYYKIMDEWKDVEATLKAQDKEKSSTLGTPTSTSTSFCNSNNINNNITNDNNKKLQQLPSNSSLTFIRKDSSLCSDVFESTDDVTVTSSKTTTTKTMTNEQPQQTTVTKVTPRFSSTSSFSSSSSSSSSTQHQQPLQQSHARRMLEKLNTGSSSSSSRKATFTLSDDSVSMDSESDKSQNDATPPPPPAAAAATTTTNNNNNNIELTTTTSPATSTTSTTTVAATNGIIGNGNKYPNDLLESFALNLHRIDKDVHRCDRNHAFFTHLTNLNKLRNIMATYVWRNMEMGYVQGMCDLVAPLLVIMDDEPKVYSCFCELMRRMSANFPNGSAMDQHFGNMRSLIQIMDPELFEHMRQYGDYTHFYFSYRWFLLDFKRELVYTDIFMVWETIWTAKHICSRHFVLFVALAMVEYYRDIIIDNQMDFTDIIKFFNELAEKHNASEIVNIARELVSRLQEMIENK